MRLAVQVLRTTIIENPLIPHIPTAKQAAFLSCPTLEAMYGGAAGGGKSDALLMGAAQYARIPGSESLLLRRTYADLALPGAIMDRSLEWWSGHPLMRWDARDKTWYVKDGGRIVFGYLATDADLNRYQGSNYTFIGPDELTQFTEKQYRYLFSRLRRTSGARVPLRMRAASNPGGVGHDWVKQRFITEGISQGRPFFPARLVDNPYLDQDEYERSLMNLDPVTRAQLLAGDWDARPDGGYFERRWFPIVHAPLEHARRVRRWDFAATTLNEADDPDYSVGLLLARDRDGRMCVEDVIRVRETPGEIERLVRQTAEIDGVDVAVRLEQEPGSAGKALVAHYIRDVLLGYDVRAYPATGDKITRAMPASAQAHAGNIALYPGRWTTAFLDELEGFPDAGHDDQVDALSGAVAEFATSSEWGAV